MIQKGNKRSVVRFVKKYDIIKRKRRELMKRPMSIIVILGLILLYNIVKIIGVIWIFLSQGSQLEFFLVDLLYGLICFVSGILVFFWKKQGIKLYQISNFGMLFICIAISYIIEVSIDIFAVTFIPIVLWSILNSFVKKTKYFELK